MNPYLQNLTRIEFPVTYRCTGRCRHCSEGDRLGKGPSVEPESAARAVREIAAHWKITSLMTFGGEPLLAPEAVFAIHAAARDANIPKRQLITNGCFSRDESAIRRMASRLVESGVNDVLLSVDAFHQETIPLEPVVSFARALLECGMMRLRTSPAWLRGPDADNPFDPKTRGIVDFFREMGVEAARGNVIFPAGRAKTYLAEYFDPETDYSNPYDEDPNDLHAVSVEPDGTLLGGNINTEGAVSILERYAPPAEA